MGAQNRIHYHHTAAAGVVVEVVANRESHMTPDAAVGVDQTNTRSFVVVVVEGVEVGSALVQVYAWVH